MRSQVGDQWIGRHRRTPAWKAGRVSFTTDTSYNARQELQTRRHSSEVSRREHSVECRIVRSAVRRLSLARDCTATSADAARALARSLLYSLSSAASIPQASRGSVPGRDGEPSPKASHPQDAGRHRRHVGHNRPFPRVAAAGERSPLSRTFQTHTSVPLSKDNLPLPPPSPKAAVLFWHHFRGRSSGMLAMRIAVTAMTCAPWIKFGSFALSKVSLCVW